jgi:hypothetical protein
VDRGEDPNVRCLPKKVGRRTAVFEASLSENHQLA